jgi:hypothetical protein
MTRNENRHHLKTRIFESHSEPPDPCGARRTSGIKLVVNTRECAPRSLVASCLTVPPAGPIGYTKAINTLQSLIDPLFLGLFP